MRTRLAALLFFFAPAVAFALGVRRGDGEQPLPPVPAIGGDWDAWATAHLPLRQQAVRANVFLTESVFGHAPAFGHGYPKVIEGRDGWLYFGDDVTEACAAANAPSARPSTRCGAWASRSRRPANASSSPSPPTRRRSRRSGSPTASPARSACTPARPKFWTAARSREPAQVRRPARPLEQLQRGGGKPAYWRNRQPLDRPGGRSLRRRGRPRPRPRPGRGDRARPYGPGATRGGPRPAARRSTRGDDRALPASSATARARTSPRPS